MNIHNFINNLGGFNMGYMTLIDLPAHWLHIPHNPRNNKRTKPVKK